MEETKQKSRIIAILDDLFFNSKIKEAVKPLGLDIEFIKNPNGLTERLRFDKPSLIVLDLNSKSCTPLQIIKDLKSSPVLKDIPILGYLSHVQTDLKEEAAKAGCDVVLPRSKFSRELKEILMKYST